MTIKTYLFEMTIGTILCFISWMLVIIYIDPNTTGFVGFVLFYLNMFFFLTCFFSLFSFCLRRKFLKNEVKFKQTWIAFRQGFLLAATFIGTLLLRKLSMLSLGNAILLISAIVLIEIYFMKKK